jgi:hypothetical protein
MDTLSKRAGAPEFAGNTHHVDDMVDYCMISYVLAGPNVFVRP